MTRSNEIFGFPKSEESGNWGSSNSSQNMWGNSNEEPTSLDSSYVGDPISQNFGGEGYSNMSGWKTFWQSTLQPKKYKENKLNESREDVDRKYPTEGSCSVLSDRLDKITDEISSNVYKTGGKGAARVSERQIKALKERKQEVKDKKEEECYVDPEIQFQMEQQHRDEMAKKSKTKNIIAYSITGLVFIGVGVASYFMFKGKGKIKKGKI